MTLSAQRDGGTPSDKAGETVTPSLLPSSNGSGQLPPQAANGGSNPSGSANTLCPKHGVMQWTCSYEECSCHLKKNILIELCAVVALEQRCERETPWDHACLAIAREIRKLKS